MAGSFVSNPHGAEISERSRELVLPDQGEDEQVGPLRVRGPRRGKETSVSETRGTAHPETSAQPRTGARSAAAETAKSLTPASDSAPGSAATPETAGATGSDSDVEERSGSRGFALPGDRGPRQHEGEGQRPSFWRRIALGRRTAEADPIPQRSASRTTESRVVAPESKREVERKQAAAIANIDSVERRIVEPMLQALVSVEAKLERSHSELVGRSDQVEQRLTGLWDIEEQLGTLSELQESLLQVSEQQRRLESAVVSQTRTLRWLIGAVFVSLAAAAFVVAAILR
jgi:hypothetical protein